MEQRFGVREPNITPWRRAVCGDLTSAFDFSMTPGAAPTLPNTDAFAPPDNLRHPSSSPRARRSSSACRSRSRASGPRAPLGYRLHVDLHVSATGWTSRSLNRGRLGAQLQARSNDVAGAPFSYTVGRRPHAHADAEGPRPLRRQLPRARTGSSAGSRATRPHPCSTYGAAKRDGHLVLRVHNHSDQTLRVQVADAYGRDRTVKVRPKDRPHHPDPAGRDQGLVRRELVTVAGHPHVERALAGRFENGRDGTSDPQLGR